MALEWMAEHETRNGKPKTAVDYMALHQHDLNAGPLWTYFQNVLHWAKSTFNMKKFKNIMKGLDWAKLYDMFHEKPLNTKAMEAQIADLVGDDEIQKPQGIIPYVPNKKKFDLEEFRKHLSGLGDSLLAVSDGEIV